MTDRELLEMAAKAAEFGQETKHGPCWTESKYPRGSKTHGALWNYKGHMDTAELWNPLTDDGDALRLAVTLGLDVECLDFATQVNYDIRGILYRCNIGKNEGKCNGDIYVATRLAIVIAAAEIGKAMP